MKHLLFCITLFISTIYLSQTDTKSKEDKSLPDPPLTIAERMPSFPSKMDDMEQFIQEHIKYPKDKDFKGITTAFVTMVVEKDGS